MKRTFALIAYVVKVASFGWLDWWLWLVVSFGLWLMAVAGLASFGSWTGHLNQSGRLNKTGYLDRSGPHADKIKETTLRQG